MQDVFYVKNIKYAIKNINFYKPLILVLIYIAFSLWLSVYGPIKYSGYEPISVIIYVSLFMCLFSMSYVLGIKVKRDCKINFINSKKRVAVLGFVKCMIAINALYALSLLVGFLISGGNFGLADAGEAYVGGYLEYERGSGDYSIEFIVSTIMKLPYMVTLILGAFYFKNLRLSYKYMIVLSVFVILFISTVGYGKNKQIGDFLIFLSAVLLIIYNSGAKTLNKKLIMSFFLVFFLGGILILYLLYLRYEAIGVGINNINEKVHPLMFYDMDSFVFYSDLGFPIAVLSGYVTQGWYGLYLAMQLPFEWTYFFGNSYSLMIIYDKFLGGMSLLDTSYPYRVGVEYGWDESKWHSWFTWFASDYSFLGVMFLAIPMGYLYAISWKESILYSNPTSVFVFSQFSLGLVFLPANNQLLHSPGGLLVFLGGILLWFLVGKKLNFRL